MKNPLPGTTRVSYIMSDFLNLPFIKTLSVQDNGDHYVVNVDGGAIPTACPSCASTSLYKHGSTKQSFMDTPMHGKRVIIHLERKRYRCKVCGKTLLEPLDAMDGKRMSTERLTQYIEKHSLKKTFADISREVGVDEKTVRHVFDDYVERLKRTVHFETPQIMGIDELKIIGSYRCMITNIGKLSIYDMLQTRKKVDVIEYFKRMPDKHKVEIISMDMWRPYLDAAHNQFPGILVIADRFHVVRMANNAMESVRKQVRKSLDRKDRIKLKDDRFILLARKHNLTDKQLETLERWMEQFPVLGEAYKAKESFFDIYEQPDKASAQQAFIDWSKYMHPVIEPTFHEMIISINNWWNEVFNYYDFPITNGYTESANNLAKGMNRMGRGYSFDVIRARLIYDSNSRDVTKTTIRGRGGKRNEPLSGVGYSIDKTGATETEDTVIEYGPHIPTLVKLLEDGYFS